MSAHVATCEEIYIMDCDCFVVHRIWQDEYENAQRKALETFKNATE